jgi:HEAT repeat protein
MPTHLAFPHPRLPLLLTLLAAAAVSPTTPTSSAAGLATFDDPRTPASVAPLTAIQSSEIREKALSTILQLAKSENAQVRANAVEVAGFVPARLRSVIENGVSDPNDAVKTVALMMIGKAKLADLTDRARPLTNDPSPYVKTAALFALAKNGKDADISPLADVLLNNPTPRIRAHAAVLIGELGNSSANPLLRSAAARTTANATPVQARLLELQIAEAMVKLGEEDQRQTIRAALYPSNPEELEASALAIQIIGLTQDKAAIPQLVNLVDAKDRQNKPFPAEIRMAIAASMASFGKPQGISIADEFIKAPLPALRAQAAFVYGEGGTAYWSKLSELLDDADPTVRVAAAGGVLKSWARQSGNR